MKYRKLSDAPVLVAPLTYDEQRALWQERRAAIAEERASLVAYFAAPWGSPEHREALAAVRTAERRIAAATEALGLPVASMPMPRKTPPAIKEQAA